MTCCTMPGLAGLPCTQNSVNNNLDIHKNILKIIKINKNKDVIYKKYI
jgi:hypothetical protein